MWPRHIKPKFKPILTEISWLTFDLQLTKLLFLVNCNNISSVYSCWDLKCDWFTAGNPSQWTNCGFFPQSWAQTVLTWMVHLMMLRHQTVRCHWELTMKDITLVHFCPKIKPRKQTNVMHILCWKFTAQAEICHVQVSWTFQNSPCFQLHCPANILLCFTLAKKISCDGLAMQRSSSSM